MDQLIGDTGIVEIRGADLNRRCSGDEEFHYIVDRGNAADLPGLGQAEMPIKFCRWDVRQFSGADEGQNVFRTGDEKMPMRVAVPIFKVIV